MADADKPLVVCCDVYTREIYGAQRSLLELYTEWHRRGKYRLRFVYPLPGALPKAFDALGIETTQLAVGPLLGSFHKRLLNLRRWEYAPLVREVLSYSHELKRFLIGVEADLLHCNGDRAGMMSFVGARWARCPMVTHIRRDCSFGWRDGLIHRGTTEIVWVSNRVRDQFARNNNIRQPKGRVIYNGRSLVDRDGPRTHADVRDEFALRRDAYLAVAAANFDERKDHETLIRAAKIACDAEARLYFLLAGTDATPDQTRWKKIEAMVGDAGLSNHVLFLGHRRDIGRLLRGVDILVNSAKEEALGGALIEAIGYGVPCVATDAGGTAEIVPHGRCGFLVPRGDYESLAARIVELVRDESTKHTFAKNARAHFDENFTLARCVENTGAFFDEIVARHRRRTA